MHLHQLWVNFCTNAHVIIHFESHSKSKQYFEKFLSSLIYPACWTYTNKDIFTFSPPASSSIFEPEGVLDLCLFVLVSVPLFSSSAIANTNLQAKIDRRSEECQTLIPHVTKVCLIQVAFDWSTTIRTMRRAAGEQTLHQSFRTWKPNRKCTIIATKSIAW